MPQLLPDLPVPHPCAHLACLRPRLQLCETVAAQVGELALENASLRQQMKKLTDKQVLLCARAQRESAPVYGLLLAWRETNGCTEHPSHASLRSLSAHWRGCLAESPVSSTLLRAVCCL